MADPFPTLRPSVVPACSTRPSGYCSCFCMPFNPCRFRTLAPQTYQTQDTKCIPICLKLSFFPPSPENSTILQDPTEPHWKIQNHSAWAVRTLLWASVATPPVFSWTLVLLAVRGLCKVGPIKHLRIPGEGSRWTSNSLVLKHFRTELTYCIGDTLNLQCIWFSRSCVFKSRPVCHLQGMLWDSHETLRHG